MRLLNRLEALEKRQGWLLFELLKVRGRRVLWDVCAPGTQAVGEVISGGLKHLVLIGSPIVDPRLVDLSPELSVALFVGRWP
jgi:hypothetical protein